MKTLKVSWWGMMLVLMMFMTAPVFAEDGEVILNPGNLIGSVSVTGYQIQSISIYALDTDGVYSSQTTVDVGTGADSIDYNLTVEGDRAYYVVATARVVADTYTSTVLPLEGPITIPIFENPGDEVTLDMSVEPAIISGTLSTLEDSGSIIENYSARASITIPELNSFFSNYTSESNIDAPGVPGVDYTLLVAPGVDYSLSLSTGIDGIYYSENGGTVTAPAAGATLDQDFVIDVTAATVSGTVALQGVDVYGASVSGMAFPFRTNSVGVQDLETGAYTLDVDAGSWSLDASFYYTLPGDLNHLTGHFTSKRNYVSNIANGDDITGVDFIIDPGFIPGTLSLYGANTDLDRASVTGYSNTDGITSYSNVDPETGEFMIVGPPGEWEYGYSQYLRFDYPNEPASILSSSVSTTRYGSTDTKTVTAGETSDEVSISIGTATVKYYYYVAGEGILSSPRLYATLQSGDVSSYASGFGSTTPTTEGQAMVTVVEPGTYFIEAMGTVEGSIAEFGTATVDIDPGDVIVIGGTNAPTLKVNTVEVPCADTATIEGVATDDVGIATITINGTSVPFTSSANPDDPNEVVFSYEIDLPVIGPNPVEVIATDIDETYPIPLTLTVIREECVPVDPECDYPLNVEDFDIFVFGDVSDIIHNSGNLAASGNVSLSDFGLNQIAGHDVGLVVGNDLTLLNDGFVEGDVYYGGLATIDPSVTINGDIYPDASLLSCFEEEEEELKECSDFNSRLTPNSTTVVDACWINLTGVDFVKNIFELPTSPQAQMPCGVNLTAPAGSMVVINVPGATPAFGQLAFNLYGPAESNIIWNFYEATTVSISNAQFPGTIFAPYAEVVLTSTHVDGTIVANSLSAPDFTGEVDNSRFIHWEQLCVDSNESCSDLVQNQDETAVDCGGWCGATCELGTACVDDTDCASDYCFQGVCEEAAPVSSCSEETAVELGARGVEVIVADNTCLMIRDDLPSWWNGTSIRLDSTGTFSGDVPFSWTNTCAEGSGEESFSGAWQQRTLTPVSKDCATLIELQGTGGDIGLRWY